MFEINVKSPTRVDLAGGTLDLWPHYLFLNNPITINVAIDIFSYVELRESDSLKIELTSSDMNASKSYDDLDQALADTDPAFELVRAHLRFWRPSRGFALNTRSESPIGAGLGGSSSMCISLLKAFSAWLKAPLEPYEMVRIASNLEAQVLQKPTGTQDYFPPIFGGLNMITYGVKGPQVEVRPIDRTLFEDRFLLVYTGKQHHSGLNNWQVFKNYLDGDKGTRKALHDLAEVSQAMKSALVAGNLAELPHLFTREYQARTALSEGFSSPEIRRLAELASTVGANAKICGAGGGGCVMIWCPDRQEKKARELCQREGFTVLPTRPWEAR